MKVVKGEVSQVQISNVTSTERSGDEQRVVTHHIHKFVLGGKSYSYSKRGSALNIADSNVLSLAVGMFGIKKIYNHSTDEYSHPEPISELLMLVFAIGLIVFAWLMVLAENFYKVIPSDLHFAPAVLFTLLCIIASFRIIGSFGAYRLLRL